MVKSDLIEALRTENPSVPLGDLKKAVDIVFEEISQALTAGGRVELRGFGAFSVRTHGPRSGRNPKTGVTVDVAAKSRVHFKPGKDMRERLIKAATRLELECVD